MLRDGIETEIRNDIGRIFRGISPCDLVMADIPADTPDGRVRFLLDVCREQEWGGD